MFMYAIRLHYIYILTDCCDCKEYENGFMDGWYNKLLLLSNLYIDVIGKWKVCVHTVYWLYRIEYGQAAM